MSGTLTSALRTGRRPGAQSAHNASSLRWLANAEGEAAPASQLLTRAQDEWIGRSVRSPGEQALAQRKAQATKASVTEYRQRTHG